ncbi:hypothetical protein LEP1GSC008_4313 [Leptospira kirschneri serovar Bulgarica str. Nikolaevo]|uniref:Uncharacterized protein n=1 Tax=Leptospira kirschneri serovar Bulgarica str. Nikolaevo TaxID=1240687 RepID=M6EZI7_9LEPT|nr:hypothetical protein LEP1GSC008_4313 [Leptospira kirschneri serovar Bulgarica str. Nikolaevo]
MAVFLGAGRFSTEKEKSHLKFSRNARKSAERLTGKREPQFCPYYGQKM